MQGVCKGCGQVQEVPATNQEEAEERATLSCNCGESEKIRNREELMNRLDRICGTEGVELGFDLVEAKSLDRIKEAAALVFEGKFEKTTFSVASSIVTVKKKGDEVEVDRKMTLHLKETSRA